jgi:hypothetical protein
MIRPDNAGEGVGAVEKPYWNSPAKKTLRGCKTSKVKQKLPGKRSMTTTLTNESTKDGLQEISRAGASQPGSTSGFSAVPTHPLASIIRVYCVTDSPANEGLQDTYILRGDVFLLRKTCACRF